jgi:hypothetical protein
MTIDVLAIRGQEGGNYRESDSVIWDLVIYHH